MARRASLSVFALSVLLVGMGWAFPASRQAVGGEQLWARWSGPLMDPWRETQSSFDRLFTSNNGSAQVAGALDFAMSLQPRPSFEQGQRVVLEIESPRRGYWRATTYEHYTGTAMISTDIQSRDAQANEIWVGAETSAPLARVEQHVYVKAAQTSTLVGLATPLQVSVPARWEYRVLPTDLSAIRLGHPLRRGQSYAIVSTVSSASAVQLRGASTVYPSWIERYLQLPDELPARISQKTDSLVNTTDIAFDRAVAIESYLRTMTYDKQAPVPPGRDWVDYLLFDSQRGYCDYFATAMVVMLRTLGIPARVASGFASGDYDALQGRYVVHEDDAHSWVEAYLPPYGWIPFEPSAIRDVPARSSVANPSTATAPREAPAGESLPRPQTPQQSEPTEANPTAIARTEQGTPSAWVVLGGLLALLALILAVGYAVLALVWRRGLGRLHWHERPYAELRRLVDWLGPPVPAGRTAFEFEAWLVSLVPSLGPQLERVIRTYVGVQYGGRSDPSAQASSDEAWHTARPLLVRALLRRRWHALLARMRLGRSARAPGKFP